MTSSVFLIKIGGVGFNLLLLFAYLGIRALTKTREHFYAGTSREYDALRKGDVTVTELSAGIWGVNTSKVIAYASFGLGTVILAAIFIYEQRLTGYDALYFYILIGIVAISMLSYFLSLQLWLLVMDYGGTANSKILYRRQATLFQVIGWYAIHVSIILAILAVNTVTGYIVSLVNMAAAVYLIEIKAIVALRERADNATKNELQRSLELGTVYKKNDAPLQPYEGQPLRVLSWNVERGFDPDLLVEYLLAVNPDIACLQEVDWGNDRTGGEDVLDAIAHRTGMAGYFGIEFYEIASPARPREFAGGGVHGNAILTRIEPAEVYRVELPVLFDWEHPPYGKDRTARKEKRIGARFALCADFLWAGTAVTVCTVHLEDKAGGVDGRVRQLRHLADALGERRAPAHTQVIAGDMNTLDTWLARLYGASTGREARHKPWNVPECAWWKTKVLPGLGYEDPFTCRDWTHQRTRLYRQKLDWILLKNATVLRQGMGDFHSSDHRPLWIDVVPSP